MRPSRNTHARPAPVAPPQTFDRSEVRRPFALSPRKRPSRNKRDNHCGGPAIDVSPSLRQQVWRSWVATPAMFENAASRPYGAPAGVRQTRRGTLCVKNATWGRLKPGHFKVNAVHLLAANVSTTLQNSAYSFQIKMERQHAGRGSRSRFVSDAFRPLFPSESSPAPPVLYWSPHTPKFFQSPRSARRRRPRTRRPVSRLASSASTAFQYFTFTASDARRR